jgi:hypothetical protein
MNTAFRKIEYIDGTIAYIRTEAITLIEPSGYGRTVNIYLFGDTKAVKVVGTLKLLWKVLD